ncbi:MAG: VOC family protein [Stellaceae bacterium]
MDARQETEVTPSVYGAVRLGYALVESAHLADWKRFTVDGLGMAAVEQTETLLALRTDDHARRLMVRRADSEDVAALGWEVAGDAALEVILARLQARNVAVEKVEGEEAALRGVKRLWRFSGPKRLACELFTDPVLVSALSPDTGGFVTGAGGMGHVAIMTRKPEAMIAFWRAIFDAKISDFVEQKISGLDFKFTFLRLNPRHHSIAVCATRGLAIDPIRTKIQHIEMQVATLDHVTEAYRRCRALGFKIGMSMGQHTNDRSVSFYTISPSGFYFELGWNPATIEDAMEWPQVTHPAISFWGHKPQHQTVGEKIAQLRAGVSSLFRSEYTAF